MTVKNVSQKEKTRREKTCRVKGQQHHLTVQRELQLKALPAGADYLYSLNCTLIYLSWCLEPLTSSASIRILSTH